MDRTATSPYVFAWKREQPLNWTQNFSAASDNPVSAVRRATGGEGSPRTVSVADVVSPRSGVFAFRYAVGVPAIGLAALARGGNPPVGGPRPAPPTDPNLLAVSPPSMCSTRRSKFGTRV